jgi:hypothetical protein
MGPNNTFMDKLRANKSKISIEFILPKTAPTQKIVKYP